MRFADALMDGDGNLSVDFSAAQLKSRRGGRTRSDSCRKFECLSPRSLISRWLSFAKKSKGRKVAEVESEEAERDSRGNGLEREVGKERKEEVTCSMNILNGESSSCVLEMKGDREISDVSAAEKCRKEVCFNFAVGFGLLYLLAASKNELNKMIKLRTEMELLLQNVKEEFENRSREIVCKVSESNEIHSRSTTYTRESLCCNGHVSLQSPLSEKTADSETTELCDQSLTCKANRQEKCMEEIDQLEAELEAELERLQFHLDTGDTFENPKRERVEVTVEDTAPGQSQNTSFGEDADHPEPVTIENFGVAPIELERRLHELLESRRLERIKELEAALERANLKLCEKDTEVCWWKDTARLKSQHVTKPSSLDAVARKCVIGMQADLTAENKKTDRMKVSAKKK